MKKRRYEKFLAAMFSGILLTSFLGGCGTTPTAASEDIVLLEPVGVGEIYETAARRTLYDAKVYNGLICPYTSEYSLENAMQFGGYEALPGEAVNKGQVLMLTNTEGIEKQIEQMEETIAANEKDYQEYLKEANESLAVAKSDENFWGTAVENWEKEKPATDDPGYGAWEADNKYYTSKYSNALISRQKQEEAIRQRTGLYETDSRYNQLQLKRLKEDKSQCTLLSGMKGVVTNIRLLNNNDYMEADAPMVAVADLDRKLLKTEYISKTDINKAEDVYAIIDGKRYEVEYETMEIEEYNRLQEENGAVYTTFYLAGDTSEIPYGSYAVIVVMNKSKRDVVTIPISAITREDNNTYVYVLREGERVYTEIKTGMQEGSYIEVLSGVEEGDKILSDQSPETTDKTVTLSRGDVSHSFSAQGYLEYPVQKAISNPVTYGTVYFEELKVNLYQQVKKGDVIAEIRVVPDEVELARNEKKLNRERERLAELKKENAEENKKTIEAKEESIAELEELIAEMKADFATTTIVAPYDGIITSMTYELWRGTMKKGDLLAKNKNLVWLAAQDSNYILVEDKNNLLTYGNVAEIGYTDIEDKPVTIHGDVVSLNQYSVSSDLLGDDGFALIKISPEDISSVAGSTLGSNGWWNRSHFNVKVATRNMKNVILVPKQAVEIRGNVTYVRVKQADGEVVYQSFVAGGSDNTNYWVAEGLTEGMEVCIK